MGKVYGSFWEWTVVIAKKKENTDKDIKSEKIQFSENRTSHYIAIYLID